MSILRTRPPYLCIHGGYQPRPDFRCFPLPPPLPPLVCPPLRDLDPDGSPPPDPDPEFGGGIGGCKLLEGLGRDEGWLGGLCWSASHSKSFALSLRIQPMKKPSSLVADFPDGSSRNLSIKLHLQALGWDFAMALI